MLFFLAYILLSCYRGKDVLDFLAAGGSQLAQVMTQELEAADEFGYATINTVKDKAVNQTGAHAKKMAIQKMTNRLETDDVKAKLAKAKETDADTTRLEAAVDKRWPKIMASAQWFTAKAGTSVSS